VHVVLERNGDAGKGTRLLSPCEALVGRLGGIKRKPCRQSYGTWEQVSPAGAERFVIGKHGFEAFAQVAPNCRNKKNGYAHQADWINGKELAQSIRASMADDAGDEAYARPLRNMLKKINTSLKSFTSQK